MPFASSSSSRRTTSGRTCRGSWPGCGPRSRRPTCSSPTTQPRRHRSDRRRPRGGRRPRPRAAPPRQAGPRRGLPRRLRLGLAGTATTSSSRWTPTARTSPSSCPTCSTRVDAGADLVLGSRWVPGGSGRELAAAPRGAQPRRQPLRPGRCSASRSRDATGGYRAFRPDARWRRSTSTTSPRRATASRSTSPGGRCGRAAGRGGADHVRRARAGESKMSRAIVVEALWRVTGWGARYRAGRCAERVRGHRAVSSGGRRLAGPPARRPEPR